MEELDETVIAERAEHLKQFKDAVMARLTIINENDAMNVRDGCENLYFDGYTVDEAVKHCRNLEEVNPTLSEETALKHISALKEKVRLRRAEYIANLCEGKAREPLSEEDLKESVRVLRLNRYLGDDTCVRCDTPIGPPYVICAKCENEGARPVAPKARR